MYMTAQISGQQLADEILEDVGIITATAVMAKVVLADTPESHFTDKSKDEALAKASDLFEDKLTPAINGAERLANQVQPQGEPDEALVDQAKAAVAESADILAEITSLYPDADSRPGQALDLHHA